MGLTVVLHCAGAVGMGNFKAQMKRADAAGAHYTVILGEDELAAGQVTIKPMRGGGEQMTVLASDAASVLMQKIAGV